MKLSKASLTKIKVESVRKVEQGEVIRYAKAIGATGDAHFDSKAAQKCGFKDIVAPITFPAALEPLEELSEKMEVESHRLMLVEQRFEYSKPICAGDEIVIKTNITKAQDKAVANNKVTFIYTETIGKNKRNTELFKGARTYVYTHAK